MALPPSNGYHVNMIATHLEEINIEHADALLAAQDEWPSKDFQLQSWKKMSTRVQPFSPCKSPVSPFQLYHRGCSCYRHQHDVLFMSKSSVISDSGSSVEQGSPCNKCHTHLACTSDIGDELDSLPSLKTSVDCKQSSSVRKSCTSSGELSVRTEGGGELASSSSLSPVYNHNDKKSPSHNACKLSHSSSIRQNSVGISTKPRESNFNKLRPSSSRRGRLSQPLHPHPRHSHPALMVGEPHLFTSSRVSSAGNLSKLSDASMALRTSLSKACQIQQQIDVSGRKLESAALQVPALELALRPLASDFAGVMELCSFIDRTTSPTLALLEACKTVKRLAPAIKAGPAREEGVGIYLEQVSSLESSLRYLYGHSAHVMQLLQGAIEMLGGSRIIDNFSLLKFKEILSVIKLDPSFCPDRWSFGLELLECASSHLESHFAYIISKNALIIQLPTTPSDRSSEALTLLPEASLHALKAIATRLSFEGKLHQCLCMYEKAREVAIRKSLKMLGVSVRYLRHSSPEAVQALQWETLEEHITSWLNQMEVVVRVLLLSERKLISHVFDQFSDSKSGLQWQACFARLALKGALQHWLKFGLAVARSIREPQKLFKLLDMFECIEGLRLTVAEVVLSGDACKQARQHIFTLQEEVGKSAFQVLTVFGEQVDGDEDAVAPSNGGVMRLASYVVNYVKCLVGESYRPPIERIMQEEAGDGNHLKAAMLLVMQALERNVEFKAKGLQTSHPALGQLFLMNNHWYIYTRCKNTELVTILGTPWLRKHKLRSEKCAMRYRRESWGALLSVLSGPDGLPLGLGSSGVSRRLFRQHIVEFEDAFVELYRVHESWSVSDPLLRSQLGITVLRTFVPTLAALYGQFAPFLPSALQMAYTPQRIQQMIAALFGMPDDNLWLPIQELADAPTKMRSFH